MSHHHVIGHPHSGHMQIKYNCSRSGILLVIQFTNLQYLLPVLEKRGLELGLLFLVLAVLVPFASGRVPGQEVPLFVSVSGIIAIISGALATI